MDPVGAALAAARRGGQAPPPPPLRSLSSSSPPPPPPPPPTPVAVNDSRVTVCDAVVVATPLELSWGLVLDVPAGASPPPLGGGGGNGAADASTGGGVTPPPRPYHTTVATFVRGAIEPTYFGFPPDCCACVPEVVLTTRAGPRAGVPFTSLSALVPLMPRGAPCGGGNGGGGGDGGGGDGADAAGVPDRALFKLFSAAPLSAADLGRLFRTHTVLAVIPWAAYPSYDPPLPLGSFVLGGGGAPAGAPGGRLVYANAIESAASAMEMSALGGKAAADLVAAALGLDAGGGRPAGADGDAPLPSQGRVEL